MNAETQRTRRNSRKWERLVGSAYTTAEHFSVEQIDEYSASGADGCWANDARPLYCNRMRNYSGQRVDVVALHSPEITHHYDDHFCDQHVIIPHFLASGSG